MLNKNVADFTNFDGKTNKRIMQAPGGASSISLAWPNEQHTNMINNTKPKQEMEGYYRPPVYQYQGSDYSYPDYSPKPGQMGGYYGYKNTEPVSQNNPYPYANRGIAPYSPANRSNSNHGNQLINQQINSINYGIRNLNSNTTNSNDRSYGQGYAYGSANGYYGSPKSGGYYSMPDYSSNSNAYNYNEKGHADGKYLAGNYEQLDLALKQYDRTNKPKSMSLNQANQYQYKPSIKVIGPPPSQFSIGSPNYNFWSNNQQSSRHIQSEKRVPSGQVQSYDRNTEKTSVKVSNPPGGRQSIRLG